MVEGLVKRIGGNSRIDLKKKIKVILEETTGGDRSFGVLKDQILNKYF